MPLRHFRSRHSGENEERRQCRLAANAQSSPGRIIETIQNDLRTIGVYNRSSNQCISNGTCVPAQALVATGRALCPCTMATALQDTAINLARKNLPICVLDDDPDQVEITSNRLDKDGFPVVGTTNPQDALHKIRLGGCRAVLADFRMPAMDGLAFLQKTLQYDPGIYVILMTGLYSVDTAIEAIKRGAYDFLCKPIDYARLEKTLDDLAAVFSQRSEIRDLEEQLFKISQFQGIVGKSPAMLEVFDLARKVARHFHNV